MVATPIGPINDTNFGFTVHNSGNQHLYFGRFWGEYVLCYVYRHENREDCRWYDDNPPWPEGLSQQMKLRILFRATTGQFSYTLYVNNFKFLSYRLDSSWSKGDYGISAMGDSKFSNFIISSASSLKIDIVDCSISTEALKSTIALALGIPVDSIVGINRLGCSKKRQGGEEVIISFLGTKGKSSQEIATQFQSSYSTGSGSNMILGVEISSVSAVPDPTEFATFVATGAIVGLSVGTIIAIVAGSIAGAGAITAGTVFTVKKLTSKEEKTEEIVLSDTKVNVPEPVPQSEKKKPRGVDIYNFNPNDPQSITQRAPPKKIL